MTGRPLGRCWSRMSSAPSSRRYARVRPARRITLGVRLRRARVSEREMCVQDHNPGASRVRAAWGLRARRVLDAGEWPVGFEPRTDGAPERGVEVSVVYRTHESAQASWSLQG